MFPNGIDKHTTLTDVQAQRLFRVHIFSGLTGVDGRQNPLELLRGDDDRINVLAFKDLIIVLVDGPFAFAGGLEYVGPRPIAVTEGDNLPVGRKLIEEQRSPIADANRSNRDPIVRSRLFFRGQDSGRAGRTGQRPRWRRRQLQISAIVAGIVFAFSSRGWSKGLSGVNA